MKKHFYPDELPENQAADKRHHSACRSPGCPLKGTLSNDVSGDKKTFYCRFHFFGSPENAKHVTERIWELRRDYGMTSRPAILKMLYPFGAENEYTNFVRAGGSVDGWRAKLEQQHQEQGRANG